VIREIGIDELDRLEEAAREFYAASRFLGGFRLERFRQLWTALFNTGAAVIFAEDQDGEIAGVIGGIIHRETYGEALVAEEFFWFVREAQRGAGIRLYRRFEGWARERGAASIQMVHLFDSMPEKVARFYLRSGFEPIEMRYAKSLKAEPLNPEAHAA
jgi:GNAT superfamily N-acetyltransferase